jgi:anti-anti-sigma factor
MKNRFSSGRTSVNVMRCPGDLNVSYMVQSKSRFRRLMNQRIKFFLLDLQHARHVELAGLGILVDRLRQIRSNKGDIRLFNLHPEVLKTLQMVGITGVVDTYSNEEEALQSFQAA